MEPADDTFGRAISVAKDTSNHDAVTVESLARQEGLPVLRAEEQRCTQQFQLPYLPLSPSPRHLSDTSHVDVSRFIHNPPPLSHASAEGR